MFTTACAKATAVRRSVPRRRKLTMTAKAKRGRRLVVLLLTCAACTASPPERAVTTPARHLVLITIDTLRADRVGAYGYTRARTPHIDALAARGVRFEHAYATAPITLPSHASLMTGRYPPGHGARHNGMRVDAAVPTLAKTLSAAGFATGAFVSAFPLDRRFGLTTGFADYNDHMPRGARGRFENERPGRDTVNDALAWLTTTRSAGRRLFLWVHLFEPHAPYGQAGSGRPVADRYDDEIAESDRAGRQDPGCAWSRRDLSRWSSLRPITARPLANTARSATACSSTTRRYGYRSSSRVQACRPGASVRRSRSWMSRPRCCRCWGSRASTATVSMLSRTFTGADLPGARSLRGIFCPAPRLRMEPAALPSV